MIILSLSTGFHDNSAVVADDYRILSAIQRERITRIKTDGGFQPEGSLMPKTVAEALRIAGARPSDIGQVLISRGALPAECFRWHPLRRLRDAVRARLFGKKKKSLLSSQMVKRQTTDISRFFRSDVFLRMHGLPENIPLADYNHHRAHALSALFFTDWENALIYTADGGGDSSFYSAWHYKDGELQKLFGDYGELLSHSAFSAQSVGLVYAAMTEALGFKRNRHEGKLTGLAAYGSPSVYEDIARHFSVSGEGAVETTFRSEKEMERRIAKIGKSVKPEDAAASVQKFLEETILSALTAHLKKTGAETIGLAGGVFSNVALNRRAAELPGVREIFVFPGMGDEGIAVGGVYDFLLRRDGCEKWRSQRRRLHNVLWGGEFDAEVAELFSRRAKKIAKKENAPRAAAQKIAEGKVVAIYCGRMEFGPRALGARSILANPADADINRVLNERLRRTEFMPFAPYVLAEDAGEVFDMSPAIRYAANFMTVTCPVREQWREKIPAVTHVDGTARPQIIGGDSFAVYAEVLREFKALTGLPVLINTSFNAHEEPIVYKPEECLRALNDKRVDFVLLAEGLFAAE